MAAYDASIPTQGQLKTVPDMESLQARWFEVTDVQKAESDWFSRHRIHRPGRPVVGAAKPGSFQLRAPVMHMIEAARRFCSEMGLVVSRTIPLPDSRLCGLRCILFRFVVLWIRQSDLGTNDKPSHMLVRNTSPVRLPTFRINLIDPLKAITLALGIMLPTVSSSSAFDVRRVGILKMTFVPRLPGQLSDRTCTGDGFLLTLRICLIPETSSNLILPQTTDRFVWISIEPSSDVLNTWSSELPDWMIQLPVNTDLLPLYRL
ncbi:hypothetical protein FGIG_06766 [Fasciola gigantica]|uniref:Uncharacterized protein n=1 Tax=Fasciola gigantica TaxID=46835 RepID=A0A504Z4R5_FASGI|nr:hypothetical protein FGIG_06766 [Fasciola gigantica]